MISFNYKSSGEGDFMASLNKVIIMGNLGKDPEIKHTSGGKSVASLSIATSQKWTDAQGKQREETEWHNVTVWGKTAENCGKYLSKGRTCLVEGRLQTSKYQKDGVDHWSTKIIADNVVFIGGGAKKEDASHSHKEYDDDIDSIPF